MPLQSLVVAFVPSKTEEDRTAFRWERGDDIDYDACDSDA
jgi:hypothetical protein